MRGDQTDLAEVICRVLHRIYVEKREAFEAHARERDTTLEALAATAICGLLQERSRQDSARAGVGPGPG
jgi:hypothetical protein